MVPPGTTWLTPIVLNVIRDVVSRDARDRLGISERVSCE
jgi:hypothetical protein